MAATGTTNDMKHEKSTANGLILPEFPGEDPRQHLGTQWKEEADNRLAGAGLLTVANGGAPVEVAQIIDYPLDSIPDLPWGDKEYSRRQEARLKVQIDNERNREKRAGKTMRAWAELYRAVKTCTEKTAPMLLRELISLCDMSLPHNGSHAMGWFDGPRAYRTVCDRIFGGERTKEDKNYYKMAEHLQTQHHLPDGAPAAEFSKRVIIFLTNIAPNLPQPMSADDISEYIFDLTVILRSLENAPFSTAPSFSNIDTENDLPAPSPSFSFSDSENSASFSLVVFLKFTRKLGIFNQLPHF